MYKRRDAALAELVANAWDAGATTVQIVVTESSPYDPATARIFVTDTGCGMTDDQVQDEYLVVGRNRRKTAPGSGRPVMGRNGIGKLAGFGIAEQMDVETWCNGLATRFALDAAALKQDDGATHEVKIPGSIAPVRGKESAAGTRLTLSRLKHVTPIDLDRLRESLARRFSSHIRGQMTIVVNEVPVGDPVLALERRFPEEGMSEHVLPSGQKVRYQYAFAKSPIHSTDLRGFTVYARGKTAQAPPFFFNVEGTASGQHGTRYVSGAIEADFLDDGNDDGSDIISTDRQEVDWESTSVAELRGWGEALSRQILREWSDRRAEEFSDWVMQDQEIAERLQRLDNPSQKQAKAFLRTLAQAEGATPRGRELAGSLIRAYEFRQFHDFIEDFHNVGEDPQAFYELLGHLADWKVLESRAILEIVSGRLAVIDKLGAMIVNDAPETAPRVGANNLHDMLGRYPWLLHPEWQVVAEEKSVTKQLRDWGAEDVNEPHESYQGRFDFLAVKRESGQVVVVDIKRPGHSVTYDEVTRADGYRERLTKGHSNVEVVIVGSGFNVSASVRDSWDKRPDAELMEWSKVFERVKRHYEHWRDLLRGDSTGADWQAKEKEVASVRRVLDTGSSYRTKEERKDDRDTQTGTN
jgi:hypothetical protein